MEKYNTKRSGRQVKSLVINMNGTGKLLLINKVKSNELKY